MIKGSLEKITLPEIFYDLNRNNLTGTLALNLDKGEKIIFFEKGEVVFAFSTFEKDRFGQVLLRAKKITPKELEKALKSQKEGEKFGTTLVNLGLIMPDDLVWCVKEQVRNILVDAFKFDSGGFCFTEGIEKNIDFIRLKIKMSDIVREGINGLNDPRLILRGIGNMNSNLSINKDFEKIINGFHPEPVEQELLAFVNEKTSVKTICNSVSIPAMVACKHLFLLLSNGVIRKA